jgi:hypothetical protein
MAFSTSSRIWSDQEENKLEGQGDRLKHRFLDIAKVAFWAAQKAENKFEGSDAP